MVVPERISLARQRRGLTPAELSRRVGIKPRRLSDIERGRQQPGALALARLAAELRFPESFFAADAVPELPDGAISFRARSKLSRAKRASAGSVGVLTVEFNTWLERTFSLPGPDVPTFEAPGAEVAAEMVRSQWGLGGQPVSNMVHMLEAHGIRVFSLAAEHADVDAFSFWHEGTPYAVLNTTKTPERCRFDAAHELGHLVMHAGAQEASGPEAEREADAFARAFLMPELDLRERMPLHPPVEQIIQGKAIWRVSALALTYRLSELGMLEDVEYKSACVELSKPGFRGAERSDLVRETSQLLGKAFTLLRKQGRGPREVAAELHLTSDELISMMFGLVVTAIGRTDRVFPTQQSPELVPPPYPVKLSLA